MCDDVVAWRQTYHSCHAPDVSAGTPFAAKNDFWRSVLSRLDVVCEVVPNPAGVAEICNLHRDLLECNVW